MSLFTRKVPLVGAVAFAVSAPLAQAQLILEEVIVTAQKRAESLQDVPISVSAIQGTKIQDAGIANMSALSDYIPNFKMGHAWIRRFLSHHHSRLLRSPRSQTSIVA